MIKSSRPVISDYHKGTAEKINGKLKADE